MIQQLSAASGKDVPRETLERLEAYVELLKEEARRQNLIAPSTLEAAWDRHILDSAQLLRFEPFSGAAWVDIGSGAGLPGIVIALLASGPVTLIEPRRLRAEFLAQCIDRLFLGEKVTVKCSKVERAQGKFDVITARAVAALDRLIAIAEHLSHKETVWVLPKGRSAQSELALAKRNWHCDVRVERSCTDPESEILVLTRVGAK